MANAEGVDVYNGDGTVHWKAVQQAGKSFGIAKATEGITYIDPQLKPNMAALKSLGMVRGCYHFYRFGDDPVQQAKHFLNAVHDAGYDKTIDIPLALDLEDRKGAAKLTKPQILNQVGAFLHVIEQSIGRLALFYTDADFANTFVGDAFGGHPLWLAQYSDHATPSLPTGWKSWAIWQYAETGTVSGISAGAVDHDRYNGTIDDLKKWIASGKP